MASIFSLFDKRFEDENGEKRRPRPRIDLAGTTQTNPFNAVSQPNMANVAAPVAMPETYQPTANATPATIEHQPSRMQLSNVNVPAMPEPEPVASSRPILTLGGTLPDDGTVERSLPDDVNAAGGNMPYEYQPSRIDLERAYLDRLSNPNNAEYEKPVNNDKGVLGRIKDVLRESIIGAGRAWDNSNIQDPNARLMGALGGGIGGGLAGGFRPEMDEERQRMADIQASRIRLGELEDQSTADMKRATVAAGIENQRVDNDYNRARLNEMGLDRQRKEGDRLSREKTARMTQVAGILKNLPAYNPNDPQFAELTKALGDVNLPITPKDAKKKVDMIQDARTGAWTVTLTDPVSGKQEVRPVMQNGKQLQTTPTVVMQGEYGLLRQDNQQEWQANQNYENRKFQGNLEAARMQHRTAMEQLKGEKQKAQAEGRYDSFVGGLRERYLRQNPQATAAEVDAYLDMVLSDQ